MIYFIQQGEFGPIKIGYSADPVGRLRNLATSTHVELRMLATVDGDADDERALHEKFAHHRIRREWFKPAAEILAYIGLTESIPGKIHREPIDTARPTASLGDLEILPPGPDRPTWIVRSKSANLSCQSATLKDAFMDFINYADLSVRLGWECLRFPGDDS